MVDPGSAWILVQLTHNASELNYTNCPLNCIYSALHGPFVVWCAGINVHVQSQWCVPVLFGLISNFQVIVGLKSSFMVSGKTIVTPSTETVFNARHIYLYVTVLSVDWNFHMSQKLVTTTTLAPTKCSVSTVRVEPRTICFYSSLLHQQRQAPKDTPNTVKKEFSIHETDVYFVSQVTNWIGTIESYVSRMCTHSEKDQDGLAQTQYHVYCSYQNIEFQC